MESLWRAYGLPHADHMKIRHQIPDRKVASIIARAERLEPRTKKAANDLELFKNVSIAWILTATSHFDPFLSRFDS